MGLPRTEALMTPSPGHFLTRRLAALIGAAGLIGCAHIPQPLPPAEGPLTHTVAVISNDWHTGIVIPRASLPPQRVPEAADFPSALFLQFGWGDREYYPSPRPSLGTTLAAALVPTSAVMHLAGLAAPPEDVYPDSEVLAVRLTAAGLDRLLAEIDSSFERGGSIRAEAVARGLYRGSRFYPARGRFHLFNTCNTWAARMLAAAGLDVSASGVMTAEHLMSRLRHLPNVTRRSRAPA